MINSSEKRQEYIDRHKSNRQKNGAQYRCIREIAGLTRKDISLYLVVSPSLIAKFERGDPIQRSKLVESAYGMILTLEYYDKFWQISENIPCFVPFKPVEILGCIYEGKTVTYEQMYHWTRIFDLQVHERNGQLQ